MISNLPPNSPRRLAGFARPDELPRTLPHPGPPGAPRVLVRQADLVTEIGKLRPGKLFADELIRLANELGTSSASVFLSGGELAPIHYCFPAVGDGKRAAWFSPEHVTFKAQEVTGTATVGVREGKPFVHAHLSWTDEEGNLKGGHLWPKTVVGPHPPGVTVLGLHGAEWESLNDPETTLPAFHPVAPERPLISTDIGDSEAADQIPCILARVLPGEDITDTIRCIGREAGFGRVRVQAGLGSLIGAILVKDPKEGIRAVEGPATEVISLSGALETRPEGVSSAHSHCPINEEKMLHCSLVDRHGTLHSGQLLPGENPVAVTFELLLTAA